MKVKDLLNKARKELEAGKIESAWLDPQVLLSYLLSKEKEYLHIYPDKEIEKKIEKKYFSLIKKRGQGEPLAYLVGRKEFYGLDFAVGKGVLIPRPETELIIDETLNLDLNKYSSLNLIDVGTGSGCIITTLSKLLAQKNKITFWGVDKYATPLKYARKNAEKHKQTKIKFSKSSLLDYFLKNPGELKEFNLIIANLPYLTRDQFSQEKSIQKEPKTSLISAEKGLKHYKKLLAQVTRLKKAKPGASFLIYCEINPEQAIDLTKYAQEKLRPNNLQIKKDLAGLDRLVIMKF